MIVFDSSWSGLHRLLAAAFLVCLGTAAHAETWGADPAFNGGRYYADAFAADSTQPERSFVGQKTVRLSNGDLVVAALARHPFGDQGYGYATVGLVRYDAAGVRVTWSAPGASGIDGDQYVIAPVFYDWRSIADIKAVDGKLVVLANFKTIDNSDDFTVDTRILVFDEGGAFLSETKLYPGVQRASGYLGGGLAVYHAITGYQLLVASTYPTDNRPVFSRYAIQSNGTLGAQIVLADLATSACWNPAWQCIVKGLAQSAAPLRYGLAPRFYVVYAYRTTPTSDWDVVVSRITSSGAGDPAWDPNNVHWNLADGGNRDDVPVGIAVRTNGMGTSASPYRDDIFVAMQSARRCSAGIGVIRFDHAGNPAASTIVGGDRGILGCTIPAGTTQVPNALAFDGNRLAIAGYTNQPVRFGPPNIDATVAVLDTNLALQDLRALPYPIGSPRERDSQLWGITADGDGRFSVTGALIFRADHAPANLAGKAQVGTLRVRATN